MEDFGAFIDGLDVSDSVKDELRKIKPENYIGIASTIINQ